MGESKVALFLDRVATAARAAFEEVFAVQRAGGEAAGSVPTLYEPRHAERAPVFGVACALGHATSKCFILGVDYPLISTEVLRDLRVRFESSPARLLAPRWSGKVQMLCAGYAPEVLPRIARRMTEGRLDLRGVVDEVETEIVDESELRRRYSGEPLWNVNTPEEWEEARRLL